MHDLKITPHVGIGPIYLGATRDVVRTGLAAFGFALESSRKSVDYFADASVQVEFGDDGCADFIGVSSRRDFRVTYYGTDVFDTVADQVFALIAGRDNSGEHPFDRSGFLFPSQIVTLWEADVQYDRLRGEQRLIWAQVGLGNNRYFDAVQKIEAGNA